MRVLLVHPELFHHPAPAAPSGLARVAGGLRAAGAHVRILDLAFVWNRTTHIPAVLGDFRPDVVGVGISHLDNACSHHSLSFLPQIRWIVDRLRRESPAPIVAGGPALDPAPLDLLTHLNLRHGLIGRDAQSAARVLMTVAEGRSTEGLPGAVHWDGSRYRIERGAPPVGWPSDPAHDLVRYRSHLLRGGAVPIPVTNALGANTVPRGAEEIADEAFGLSESQGVKRFLFPTLRFDEHGLGPELMEALARRPTTLRFEALAEATALTQPEFRSHLARAGCAGVRLPWSSNAPQARERLEGIGAGIAAIRPHLPVLLEATVGHAGESAETVLSDLEHIKALAPATRVLIHLGERSFEPNARLPPGDRARTGTTLWPRFDLTDDAGDDLIERVRRVGAAQAHWMVDADAYSPWYRTALAVERRTGRWPAWSWGSWLGRGSQLRLR